ncbi:unnamed protein product [Meloidogyne enterolobii]|uniref:Uncharacterized protein n=1 Tax=Meloidogyne enterolobii TaxID=390850 RepID=A0ACB0Z4S0_MELEN
MQKFIFLLIVLSAIIAVSMGQSRCQKDKDEGNSDCNKPHPTKSWWYVKGENDCKSFQYKGCGGNTNRFKSKDSCEKACKVFFINLIY